MPAFIFRESHQYTMQGSQPSSAPIVPQHDATADAFRPLRMLLLDGDDARIDEIADLMQALLPSLTVEHVRRVEEALAFVERTAYEVILAGHELPDGTSLDLLDALHDATVQVPVVVIGRGAGHGEAVSVMKAGAVDYIQRDEEAGLRALPLRLLEAMRRYQQRQRQDAQRRQQEQADLLQKVRRTVSHVNHEINNPLSIISGNAQLLVELGKMMDLDADLMQPIRDIEEASRRVADSLKRLAEVKELIPAADPLDLPRP